MTDHTLSYCAQTVRRYDPDRFLTALFAPPDRREDLFALYALNLEVAKTREVVSEPTLGLIRLQWWRDAVDQMSAGSPPRHEVAGPLAAAVARHGLDRALLDRLISGREADLDDEPPATLNCLVNYAEVTGAPLAQLAVQVLGERGDGAMQAARHVGMAWALTGLLRAVPFHASTRRRFLPTDSMARHGAREPALFEGKPDPARAAVVHDVAERARAELARARSLRGGVPRGATAALLPAALADLYLGALARAKYDPFAPQVQMTHPFRQLKLAWAGFTGRW